MHCVVVVAVCVVVVVVVVVAVVVIVVVAQNNASRQLTVYSISKAGYAGLTEIDYREREVQYILRIK